MVGFFPAFDEVDGGLAVGDFLPELAFAGLEQGEAFGEGLGALATKFGIFAEFFSIEAGTFHAEEDLEEVDLPRFKYAEAAVVAAEVGNETVVA